jgi:hypothetical protein
VPWLANLVSLVSLLAVQRTAIFDGENGDRLRPQLKGRAKGTNGDFATVCNKNFLKH